MKTLSYTLTLLSDGCIGSGFGGETVNDLLARDHHGRPVIRASHIKGLLRECLQVIGDEREWLVDLDAYCFGAEGNINNSGTVRFTDASCREIPAVREISRTSINSLGTALDTTLRTTEVVAAGTEFRGTLRLNEEAGEAVETAVKLALLTLNAVGGGRTRGSGACLISIEGENRGPGELLRHLDSQLKTASLPERASTLNVPSDLNPEPEGKAVLLQLSFTAESPVCCPEHPVGDGNVIRSGLGIPASAVLGAVITRLASTDPSAAHSAFLDQRTRAWPLLPCPYAEVLPVRVSLSHRMSKLPDERGIYDFRDATIEPYEWQNQLRDAPLKGGDGVLFRSKGEVRLWKNSEMPRLLTSHAVHKDQRNLFTVESQAPMLFTGLISLPPRAADQLMKLLQDDPVMHFGKARTIRGTGTMKVTHFDDASGFKHWEQQVFVLQSPAAIPDDWKMGAARSERALAKLVKESFGLEVLEIEEEEGVVQVSSQTACAVRFGWNRHVQGAGASGPGRLRARRVFLPGTVFKLQEPPTDLHAFLIRGLGQLCDSNADGRTQGYGALLPHPGRAIQPYKPETHIDSVQPSTRAGKWALEWFRETREGAGPSPSQIAAVYQRIEKSGKNNALAFLKRQEDRPTRIWDKWNPILKDVKVAIEKDPGEASNALRTWQDLVIANKGGR